MHDNKLFLIGNSELSHESDLLNSLNVFHRREKVSSFALELQLQTKMFGQTLRRRLLTQQSQLRLNSEIISNEFEGFLVYKYLSLEDIISLSNKVKRDINFKIYILAHRLFQFKDVVETMLQNQIPSDRIVFICFSSHLNCVVFNEAELVLKFRSTFIGHEIILLTSRALPRKVKSKAKVFRIPYFLIHFFKVILSPLQTIQLTQMIWIKRLIELVDFIQFQKMKLSPGLNFFRHSTLMTTFKSYGLMIDCYNFFDRNLVKIYYKYILKLFYLGKQGLTLPFYRLAMPFYYKVILAAYSGTRHRLLMTIYKSYGLGIDLFYFLERFYKKYFYTLLSSLRAAFNLVRHGLLMTIYKSYGLGVDSFYLLERWSKKSYYALSHALLICYFKSWGFFVDTYWISYRVAQKTILYPFFKVFWFFEFQYHKRIKRII